MVSRKFLGAGRSCLPFLRPLRPVSGFPSSRLLPHPCFTRHRLLLSCSDQTLQPRADLLLFFKVTSASFFLMPQVAPAPSPGGAMGLAGGRLRGEAVRCSPGWALPGEWSLGEGQ